MKPELTILAAAAILSNLGAAGAAYAADPAGLPPIQIQGEVSFLSGGVGEDEATAFRQAAPAYPLELQFAQQARPRDEFLADVKVAIRNRSGSLILDTSTDGPFLLAKLPAGNYRIEAEYRGETKTQAVEIRPGKHQRAVFVWTARTNSGDTLTLN